MTYRLVAGPSVPADFDMETLYDGDLHTNCEEGWGLCQRANFLIEEDSEAVG